ncbi:MAG: biotin--[acetyl-CoA-carboxylase] ligase, partial [Actinobacteria bacterium]
GRRVRAMTTQGTEVEGTAVGVGDAGQLLVETGGGTEEVTFGEIARLT